MSAQGTNEIAEVVWNNPNNNGVDQTCEMFLVVFGGALRDIQKNGCEGDYLVRVRLQFCGKGHGKGFIRIK